MCMEVTKQATAATERGEKNEIKMVIMQLQFNATSRFLYVCVRLLVH